MAVVLVGIGGADRGHVSFPDGALYGMVACHECIGSGWWDFAPYATPGGPCIDCKGVGRVWVAL